MIEVSNVRLPLDAGLETEAAFALRRAAVARACGVNPGDVSDLRLVKRSVDARKKTDVHFVATFAFSLASAQAEAALLKRGVKAPLHVKAHAPYAPYNPPAWSAAEACQRDAGCDKVPQESLHSGEDCPLAFPEAGKTLAARAAGGCPSAPSCAARPVVVGLGPAGLFAAWALAKAGAAPIVIERGETVDARLARVETFTSGGALDPESNIQFGEGGAGTFSDGKLTTNIKNPRCKDVLHIFAQAGAPEEILWEAKPHIGTDKLVDVVRALRRQIEDAGGTVIFGARFEAPVFADAAGGGMVEGESVRSLAGVRVSVARSNAKSVAALRRLALACGKGSCGEGVSEEKPGETIGFAQTLPTSSSDSSAPVAGASCAATESACESGAGRLGEASARTEFMLPAAQLVLACGHSARDTFAAVRNAGLAMERKPFSVGVRIEHPQGLIDRAQYGAAADHPALGAADYKLAVHLPNGRGVYTFCMCPGGEVVCAASEEGGVCVNGMSRHARAGANANAAVLVGVEEADLPGTDVLAGVELQRAMERAAFAAGGNTYAAPAQRVGDFLMHRAGTAAATAPQPSYARGVSWVDLHKVLPEFVAASLEEALPLLDRRLHGFASADAVMTGVETRSSSPVRIVRDKQTFESVSAAGVFPCGEGAGYAGGIMSAAVDGLRVAEAVIARHKGVVA